MYLEQNCSLNTKFLFKKCIKGEAINSKLSLINFTGMASAPQEQWDGSFLRLEEDFNGGQCKTRAKEKV